MQVLKSDNRGLDTLSSRFVVRSRREGHCDRRVVNCMTSGNVRVQSLKKYLSEKATLYFLREPYSSESGLIGRACAGNLDGSTVFSMDSAITVLMSVRVLASSGTKGRDLSRVHIPLFRYNLGVLPLNGGKLQLNKGNRYEYRVR